MAKTCVLHTTESQYLCNIQIHNSEDF
jgi:hypothetical protein